jgi:hypothetical protein
MTDDAAHLKSEPASRGGRHLQWISPVGMLLLAGALSGLYGLAWLVGLGEDLSPLFATSGVGSPGALARAALYVGLYLAFVVAAPILAIASAFFEILVRLARLAGRRSPAP